MAYQNITKEELHQRIFENLYQLINSNKLSGCEVLSAFPEKNPVFPCIVINSAVPRLQALNVQKTKFRWKARVLIEVYSLTKDGKKTNDAGMDNIMNSIRTDLPGNSFGLELDKDNPFVAEGVSPVVINDTPLTKNSLLVNFNLRL